MSSTNKNGGPTRPLIPRPPADSKHKGPNLASRRRNLPSHDSGYISSSTFKDDDSKKLFNDDDSSSSDRIIDILNSPIESRPSSSRLSKYNPLPQIGSKHLSTNTSPKFNANNDKSQQKLSKTLSNLNLNSSGESSSTNAGDEALTTSTSIVLGLRLPNGSKKEKKFASKDTMRSVMEFALKDHRNLGPTSHFTFLIMPNFVVHDLNKSIGFYKIANRSMLFVIDKKLL